MKRSRWVTGVVVAHFLSAAVFTGACFVLLVLIRQTGLEQGEDRASTITGLKIALGVLVPIAIAILVGALGLARNKLWGWWFAFLTDAVLFVIFLYSMIDDGLRSIDWDVSAFTAASLVLMVWLLVPRVRRFYWNSDSVANASLENVAAESKA